MAKNRVKIVFLSLPFSYSMKTVPPFLGAFLAVCFLLGETRAQADCVLGVGLSEDTTLIAVFQLNAFQKEQLVNFSAELKYRNDLLATKLDNIRNRHPQSNVMELNQLAQKYREVMDSMALVQAMMDKRMLALFNEKQYYLYRELCDEASRSPYIVVPKVYADTLAPPKQ